jgi:Fe-S cluster biogenesis protein NfuA
MINGSDLLKRVNDVVSKLRPYLQSDGGDIKVLEITDNYVVKVKLMGACGNCPFSENTMKAGIEQALRKEIPEITDVIAVD